MTKTSNDRITTSQIYDLVDKKISEVNASLVRLETKFDTLEAERLSVLETNFANLQGRMAIIAGVISLITSALLGLAARFIK